MKSVLCVHQGTEKYGSDRSFVHAVAALAEEETLNVEILLPANGDIVDLFEDSGLAAPNVRPLWILRRARLLSALTVGLPWRLHAVWKAARDLKTFDLVY
ncbi:MAG: glycosyltransferase family 1 protein, partial [Pseudomonadota bacterium]